MKKSIISNSTLILLLIIIINGCGLTKMTNKYDTVSYNVTPPILQVHGGKVLLKIDGKIPEKYFHKNAKVSFTPILNGEKSETKFKTITLQGEEASGGDKTISYVNGGSFTYEDEIKYNKEMLASNLNIEAIAILKDESEQLGPVKVAQGVIATSQRVQNTEEIAISNHGYEKETILSEVATIYFLVNQSTIRTSEKSDEDMKRLEEFAKLGYKTHSIDINSYASPEGTIDANDNVSERRNKSTIKYTKQILKRLKLDGADNNNLYSNTSYGEDWDGFNRLMKASNMKDKRRVLNIVNSVQDPEKREQAIRDMSELYDAIDKNILPQLRKANIKIRSYQPKRTDDNILALSISNPDSLDQSELLFAATLTKNRTTKLEIYNNAVNLYDNWRAYNNIASIYLGENNLEEAEKWLNKINSKVSNKHSDILTNKGIISARKGNLQLAQKLFDQAGTSELNQAILDIRQGKYAKAARFFKNSTSHNAVLAKILDGNNNDKCSDNTPACYYLNAILAARTSNLDMLTKNLAMAISADVSYKSLARKDLEFINFNKNQEFISITE
jgi:tetratricopeptide (TPR) repeat protein